jgi:hypothetical protein
LVKCLFGAALLTSKAQKEPPVMDSDFEKANKSQPPPLPEI